MTLAAVLPTARGALAAAIARNSWHYDVLPYTSNPIPATQPARLAGIARLFELEAPPVAAARVLELGCAGGGNLIPLAARFPNARFVGVDLSRQQVAEGRARIERLGLTNIELQCRDLTEVGAGDGTFDYIVCHGVYSWVPQEVRHSILRIAGQRLAPDGIAYVSYNVLPGWRLRQVIRDSMLLCSSSEDQPIRRVVNARRLLDVMKERSNENTVHGRLWRAEAERLGDCSDDHLFHDFLEDTNEPCTFSDFVSEAARNGLSYLAESELFTMVPENFGPDVAKTIRDISGDFLLPMEQNIDILTGRMFRQTLLVRDQRNSRISRDLDPSRLEGLHLVAPLELCETADRNGPSPWTFSAARGGRSLTTSSVAAADAIRRMIGRLPASTSVNELVGSHASEADGVVILDALFKMMIVGLLTPSSESVVGVGVLPECPIADPLAASDAANGAATTVNRRHERVGLDDVGRLVLPLLDGTRDRAALVAAVSGHARNGGVAFWKQGVRLEKDEELEACANEHVDAILRCAQKSGLLTEPDARLCSRAANRP